jgi:uncharacterized membrane protein YdbT with pleckstrin-like domain
MDFPLAALPFVVVGLFDTIMQVLRQGNADFAFTTYRLSMSAGTFRRRRRDMALQTIDSVSVKQSRIGRLLGYGTVVVTLAGGTQESWAQVTRARGLVEKIQQYLAKASVA